MKRRYCAPLVIIPLALLTLGIFQSTRQRPEQPRKMSHAELLINPMDINTATLEELESIPGINHFAAKEIIETRPHSCIEDAISSKDMEDAKPYLIVAENKKIAIEQISTKQNDPATYTIKTTSRKPIPTTPKEGLNPRKWIIVQPAPSVPQPKLLVALTKPDPTPIPRPTPKPTPETIQPPPKININTATDQELQTLPGIGPVMAGIIIAGRPYSRTRVEKLQYSIGSARFLRIQNLITTRDEKKEEEN